MDEFANRVMERLPFAQAVLDVLNHVCPHEMLSGLWDRHRGRCYNDKLLFPAFIDILRDALVLPDSRINAQFVRMESNGTAPSDSSNFYRKLGRMPTAVSRELLRRGTRTLRTLLPDSIDPLPSVFAAFDVIVLDGKTVKHMRHQMKLSRLIRGKVIGARALVALDLRSGMALTFSSDVDGMVNELKLVEPLMTQLREDVARPMLLMCDRQFDSRECFKQFCSRGGDHFLVRIRNRQSIKLIVIDAVKSVDSQGRAVLDERVRVDGIDTELRRITLERDQENVTLMTDLTARSTYSAADLLGLYKQRWSIEQVFQQVTDTFDLKTLIGSTPQATLMQLSFSLLIYNVTQLLRAWLANAGAITTSLVSIYRVFNEASGELHAWKRLCDGQWYSISRTPHELRDHLRNLIHSRWHPKQFAKSTDKGPRTRPKKTISIKGDHISIHRLQTGNYTIK